jgi:uncharacterized protein YjbJ (UPF0337 family)
MTNWTQQIREAYRALQEAELLKELNVSSAFKQDGIRGAVNAIKGNIKNRGLLSTTVGAIGGRDVSGAEHGGVINRIQKEVKSGKRSASSGDKRFDRVWGHYDKMRGDDNEKAGNLTRDGRIIKNGRIMNSPLGND